MSRVRKCLRKPFQSFVPRLINSGTRLKGVIGNDWSCASHVTIVIVARVGMRSFGVVRSEAELNELAYELHEKEEVSYCLTITMVTGLV